MGQTILLHLAQRHTDSPRPTTQSGLALQTYPNSARNTDKSYSAAPSPHHNTGSATGTAGARR